jgi:starch phosphorylase
VEIKGHQHFISQEVFLKYASPDTVRVELYADGIKGGSAVKYEMTRARQLPDRAGAYTYRASVSSARPAQRRMSVNDSRKLRNEPLS